MERFRFAVGFIGGILDEFGMIRSRDFVMDSVRYTGATMDGFDCSADWFARKRADPVESFIREWEKEIERE